jgi:tRNA (adenine22-N1)-methyltransferase
MKNINLSRRMETVVNMVSPQSFAVADVGCDHAYVSIAMINRQLAKHVIAMDVRSGPLEIARNHIAEQGLSEQIELRLGNGLEPLQPGEVDTIVIAGMGGLLMQGILERGRELLAYRAGQPELVLQPQSDISLIRKFLYANGYGILKEAMVLEEGKYYTVIKAWPRQRMPEEPDSHSFTEEDWLYGSYNLENKDAVLHQYLLWEQGILQNISQKLHRLEETESELSASTRQRLQQVERELCVNQKALSHYK